jgi:hypothetical protein
VLEDGTSTPPLRATFLTPETFANLNSFIDALRDQHIFTPVSFTRTAENEGEVMTLEGASLLINLDADFGTTLANLISALSGSSLKDPAVRADLEYIDLRFGNKLYYKLKDADAPQNAEN